MPQKIQASPGGVPSRCAIRPRRLKRPFNRFFDAIHPAEGNRSLNQQIVYLLANALELDRQFLKSAVMQDAILDVLAKGRRPKVKRK